MLIGAPGATASGVSNAGEAFLFDSSWNLVRTFQDPSPVEGEHFGSSVAISGRGSSILVGAPDVPNFPHPGFAFLFDSSGNLIQTFKDPILQKAHFAMSVAISNNGRSILIGAPGFGDFRGEAFLFDSSGNLLQTFEPGSHVGPINFGASVSMSAYTRNVLVGAPFDFGPTGTMIGSAFLFDSGGNLLQNLHDPSSEAGEQFGSSVFISAESRTIIVGAPLATSGSTGDAGKAFLFDSDGDLLQTFRGGIEGGRLGTSVSLSGDGSAVLIGETGRHDFGHAYLFDSFGNLLQTVSGRSEEHTSELQSQSNLVCRLLLEEKTTHRDAEHRVPPGLPRRDAPQPAPQSQQPTRRPTLLTWQVWRIGSRLRPTAPARPALGNE